MRIALICRNLSTFDTDATLLRLAGELTEKGYECCVFTADSGPAVQKERFDAAFSVVYNGQLTQVAVTEQKQGWVRIFTIAAANAYLFAAAVAGMMRRLQLQGEKISLLHLFSAEDVCTALLCRQYFRIPFVYSVREFGEIKQSKQDFAALSLMLPQSVFTVGSYVCTEQLAAAEAMYVIDETGSPGLWREFFCSYTGKYIEGRPFVNVSCWSQCSVAPRQKRKNELLQELQSDKEIVAACEQQPASPSTLSANVLFVSLDLLTKAERLKVLQAADYYLAETVQPEKLLAAMAAGCIPIAPRESFIQTIIRDEEQQAAEANGYLYRQEGWSKVLQRACNDFRTRPGWQQQLRQRSMMLVRDSFSIKTAAALYDSIYRGAAPVRLPFIVEQSMPPLGAGIRGGDNAEKQN